MKKSVEGRLKLKFLLLGGFTQRRWLQGSPVITKNAVDENTSKNLSLAPQC